MGVLIMTEWIVAHCHANAETRAETHLRQQGFEVYLPKFKKIRRHARRVETVIRPLFPRYLFIGFDAEQTPWRPINSTAGISYLITAGERPLTVPSWIVEQLREREDGSGLFTGVDEATLNKGDTVRITSGPFHNCLGVFNGLNDNQRVAVLLDIMGRHVRTLVPLEAVRRAS
jgi:transcriptional antiterminator RfaH